MGGLLTFFPWKGGWGLFKRGILIDDLRENEANVRPSWPNKLGQ